MNGTDQLGRDLTAWFGETAAPRVPDYTDDIVQLTAGLGQRPGWAFPERWIPMSVITLGRRTFRPAPLRTVGVLVLIGVLLTTLLVAYIGSRPRLPAPFGLAANGLIAQGDRGDILLVDPTTGQARPLVTGADQDAYPAFSSDGTRVAFERDVPGGNTNLFAIGVGGGTPLQLTPAPVNGVYGLQWSPDGSQLAFINGQLWIVKADGSGAAPLDLAASGSGFPMWRPKYDQLVFYGTQGGVFGQFVVAADGSGLELVRPAPVDAPTPAMWTPDGDHLVTALLESRVGGVDSFRIHVVTVDRLGRQVDDRTVGTQLERGWTGYGLSPDGTRVIVSTRTTAAGDGWRLAVMDLTSGTITPTGPVFRGSAYTEYWAPDGASIIASDPTLQQTWVLDPGGGSGRVATWTDAEGGSSWQRIAR